MIWFLIILVVVVVMLVAAWLEFVDELDSPGMFMFFGVVLVALAWGGFQLIGTKNSRTAQANGNQVQLWEHSTPLRALNTDSSALDGRTFLTVGYVDGDRVYSYIYESADGGIIVATMPLGYGMVYEVDGLDEPYMREVRSRGSWWWTWTSVKERTEFYVPTGSVQDSSYSVSIEEEVSP